MFDVLSGAVVLAAALWGARRGALFLAAAVASPAAGVLGGPALAERLGLDGPGGLLAAYALLSLGVFGTAAALRRAFARAGLRAWDRHLGLLAGAALGAVVAAFAAGGVVAARPDLRDGLRASPSGRVLGAVAEAVRDVLPPPARAVAAPVLAPLRRGPSS